MKMKSYEWNAILDRSFRGDIHSLVPIRQGEKSWMSEWVSERMCESIAWDKKYETESE